MISYRTVLILAVFAVSPAAAVAQNGPEDAFAGASLAFDTAAPERADYNIGDWGVAEQTGVATYTYPIEIPPGRNGMQPELTLRYSSRAPLRGGIAAGWSLNIPEIKLDRSHGEEPGGSRYRVSMGSVSGRLVEVPDDHPPFPGGESTTYRAEFDDTFTRFVHRRRAQTRDSEWLVLTTDGVRYFFDDDELPTTFKGTRWHATRQVDPHGNEIRYFWEPVFEGGGDGGAIVDVMLDRIEYTANPEAGLEPHARVDFVYIPDWETCFGSDIPMGAAHQNNLGSSGLSYLEGSRRLNSIKIWVKDEPGADWRLNRRIGLGYNIQGTTFDPDGIGLNACRQIAQDRSPHLRFRYLETISEIITRPDGVAERLPVTTFRYAVANRFVQPPAPDLPRSLEFTEQRTIERGFDHFGTTDGAQATLQDISGDGVLDRVTARQDGNVCELRWNKIFFGGDVAGGDGSVLYQIDPQTDSENRRCTVNGGLYVDESNLPEVAMETVSLHFFDFTADGVFFTADGVADVLTNRWFTTGRFDTDTIRVAPETSSPGGGSFVWRIGLHQSELRSAPGVAHRDEFPPSLPPAKPIIDMPVSPPTTPDASIPLFADLDGDGAPDFIDVGTHPRLLGDGQWQVSLTRERRFGAQAFAEPITWLVPEVRLTTDVAPDDTRRIRTGRGYLLRGEDTEHQTRTVAAGLHDINGDGLADLVVQTEDQKLKAYFNYGRGFRQDPVDLGLSAPLEQVQTDFRGSLLRDGDRGYRRRMLDVDGDGLVDMLVFHGPDDDIIRTERVEVHFNLGDRFTPAISLDTNWRRAKRLIHGDQGEWQLRTDFMDGDGDLRPDLVEWQADGHFNILSQKLPAGAPRMLSHISTERGLEIKFRYAPITDAAVVDLAHKALPQRLWVVRSTHITGGHDTPVTKRTYAYKNPAHLSPSGGREGDNEPKRFLGFREVTMTEAGEDDGPRRRTRRSYAYDENGHPDGRVVEEWVFHDEGDGRRPHRFTENTWRSLTLFDDATFVVKPLLKMTRMCPSRSDEEQCRAQRDEHRRAWLWQPHRVDGQTALWLRGTRIEPERADDADRHTSYQYQVRYGQHPFADDDYRILITEKQIDRVTGTIPDAETELAGRIRTRYSDAGLPMEERQWLDDGRVAVTRRNYDDVGNLTAETKPQQVVDGSNRKTTYAYGTHRLFVQKITNELDHTTVERYDVATGQRLARRGPNCVMVSGDQTCAGESWKRDDLGRVLEHRVPLDDADEGYLLALVEKTLYIDDASPMQVLTERRKDFGGDEWVRSNRFYDGLDRLIEKKRFRGTETDDRVDAITRYGYDALGNLNRIEVPDPRTDDGATVVYTYEYDGVGRLRRFRRPDGNGLDVSYDGLSRIYTEVTQDGTGSAWTEIYDVFDRLVEVREHYPDAEDGVTRYAYDVNDNLTRITDADGNVIELEHDFVGNRVAVRRGERVWRYAYDLNGNRIAKSEPVPEGSNEASFTTRYKYDDLDRLQRYDPASRGLSDERREELGIARITYRYDRGRNRIGRLRLVRMPYLRVAYGYNARGQITKQVRTVNVDQPVRISAAQTVARRYNALGKLKWSEWDDGQRWQIRYDERGLVGAVEWQDAQLPVVTTVAAYRRAVAGPPRVRESSLGQRREFRYDQLGRPVEDRIFAPGSEQSISTRIYAYTDSGDLASVEGDTADVSANASYSYDAQHRVVTAAGPNGYEGAFRYSPTGNVTKASVRWDGGPAREVGYEYGAVDPQAVDRLIDANGDDHARFAYDPAGNMTERVTPEGTWNFTWDGEGQIREAAGPGGRDVYHYDHRGQRVLAVTDEDARLWFAESETHFNAEGNQTRRYLHLSGTGPTLARVEDADKVELQYADGLQNLMLSLDRNAEPVTSFLYGPFGEVVQATGAENHRRRFNGKEHDAATGLRYYGFRYYDPLTLRWNSADPLYRIAPDIGLEEPRRLNLYAFSNNNPVRYYDPDGREAKSDGPSVDEITDCMWNPQCDVTRLRFDEDEEDSIGGCDPERQSCGTGAQLAELNERIRELKRLQAKTEKVAKLYAEAGQLLRRRLKGLETEGDVEGGIVVAGGIVGGGLLALGCPATMGFTCAVGLSIGSGLTVSSGVDTITGEPNSAEAQSTHRQLGKIDRGLRMVSEMESELDRRILRLKQTKRKIRSQSEKRWRDALR